MGFLKDFRAFAARGNVIDLAIGVIIGGAFGRIVTALVDDLLMPLIGWITPSGARFTDLYVVLKPGDKALADGASLEAARAAGANVFAYGHFIQTVVDFLIVAFCIFLMVRFIVSRLSPKKDEPAGPAAPTPTEALLTDIRDELRKRPA